jgi:2-dehydro-3-deoxygluconokinase
MIVLLGEALVNLSESRGRPLAKGGQLDLSFAGAEVNVAIGLARLGHDARWVSALATDPLGEMVRKGLDSEGVDTRFIEQSSGSTALMVKAPRPGLEPEVIYYRSHSVMAHSDLSEHAQAALEGAAMLYLTGITPALSPSCRRAFLHWIDTAERLGVDIWFDPNHRRKLWSDEQARELLAPLLPRFSGVLAGKDEAQMLLQSVASGAELAEQLHRSGVRHAVVKDGENGSFYHGGRERAHVPAYPVKQVIDPVGAGDAFGAGVVSGCLENLSWEESLRRGNALGAISCQCAGDWEGAPDRKTLELFMNRTTGAGR